jgi:hypothetical protein
MSSRRKTEILTSLFTVSVTAVACTALSHYGLLALDRKTGAFASVIMLFLLQLAFRGLAVNKEISFATGLRQLLPTAVKLGVLIPTSVILLLFGIQYLNQ